MNIVFSSFFTKQTDFSQHDSVGCRANNFDQIKTWHDSLVKHDLNGVIFHNECSNRFITKHTHKNISFCAYHKQHRSSYNDERFYCYRWYLLKHLNIENIFCTDIFDVEFFDDPFNLVSDKHELYVGTEQPNRSSRKWLNRKMKEVGYRNLADSEVTYNAGIVGGNRKHMLNLLDSMINKLSKADDKYNANMPSLNECLRDYDKSKIMTGFPLHNKFKSNLNREKACIKHK